MASHCFTCVCTSRNVSSTFMEGGVRSCTEVLVSSHKESHEKPRRLLKDGKMEGHWQLSWAFSRRANNEQINLWTSIWDIWAENKLQCALHCPLLVWVIQKFVWPANVNIRIFYPTLRWVRQQFTRARLWSFNPRSYLYMSVCVLCWSARETRKYVKGLQADVRWEEKGIKVNQ